MVEDTANGNHRTTLPDAVGLAEAIRVGEMSPVEAVQGAIDRIEALDGQLNAVIHRQFEQALEVADSPRPARRAVQGGTDVDQGPVG